MIEEDFAKFWLTVEIPPPQCFSFPFVTPIPKQNQTSPNGTHPRANLRLFSGITSRLFIHTGPTHNRALRHWFYHAGQSDAHAHVSLLPRRSDHVSGVLVTLSLHSMRICCTSLGNQCMRILYFRALISMRESNLCAMEGGGGHWSCVDREKPMQN
jgi:hypothetical protein